MGRGETGEFLSLINKGEGRLLGGDPYLVVITLLPGGVAQSLGCRALPAPWVELG